MKTLAVAPTGYSVTTHVRKLTIEADGEEQAILLSAFFCRLSKTPMTVEMKQLLKTFGVGPPTVITAGRGKVYTGDRRRKAK